MRLSGKTAFVNQAYWFTNAVFPNSRICKCFFILIFETRHSLNNFFLFTAFPFHCCCFVPGRVCTVPVTFPFAFFSSSFTFGKFFRPHFFVFVLYCTDSFTLVSTLLHWLRFGFLFVFSLLRSFIERHRFRSFFTLHQRRLLAQGWWLFKIFWFFLMLWILFFLCIIICIF